MPVFEPNSTKPNDDRRGADIILAPGRAGLDAGGSGLQPGGNELPDRHTVVPEIQRRLSGGAPAFTTSCAIMCAKGMALREIMDAQSVMGGMRHEFRSWPEGQGQRGKICGPRGARSPRTSWVQRRPARPLSSRRAVSIGRATSHSKALHIVFLVAFVCLH